MSRDEQLASLRADLDLERSLREAADREIENLKARLSQRDEREDALFKRLMDEIKRRENAEYELKLLKATLQSEYEATENE